MCGEVDGGIWVDENFRVGGEMGLTRSGLAQKKYATNVMLPLHMTSAQMITQMRD